MPMRKVPPPASPDAYVEALSGWRRDRVERLRAAVRRTKGLDEVIKWGHLVYLSNGPVLLIRAEEERVLFGFWRGKRLLKTEPRLRPGGKFELATLELREETDLDDGVAAKLVREAVALNRTIGDPTKASKPTAPG